MSRELPEGGGPKGHPVLILGGFLITPEAYEPMRQVLQEFTGQPVAVVPVNHLDWLLTTTAFGWARVLDRVAAMARDLVAGSDGGRVHLIGHSSGGVMLRLFLSEEPFRGRRYAGRDLACTLLTLGSPHTALRGTALRRWVDERWPGTPFADQVRYVSVAGDIASGQLHPRIRGVSARSYRAICGSAEEAGDGLVPVRSALLAGSTTLTLEEVGHGGFFAERWYGTAAVVERWAPLLDPRGSQGPGLSSPSAPR